MFGNKNEELQKQRREEALIYLKEVINANRAIKDWMIRNTYYGVLAQFGVYWLFKDIKTFTAWILGSLLLSAIWGLAAYVLRANWLSIERLREKERALVERTPLPWIRENWAMDHSDSSMTNKSFVIHFGIIVSTGIVLISVMGEANPSVKNTLNDFLSSK